MLALRRSGPRIERHVGDAILRLSCEDLEPQYLLSVEQHLVWEADGLTATSTRRCLSVEPLWCFSPISVPFT